jgi:tRNA pseudouridine55 synthase
LPTRIDGVLVVDKSLGPTSHDVVATARRALGSDRVGHTGTLDPNASGVLPLVIGQATRLARHLTSTEKEYEATIRFGVETDTYDSTGQVQRETGALPSADALGAALDRFRGAFDQMPPIYSAKNVGGHRAYDLARRSKAVQLETVPVLVRELELLSFEPPHARVRLVCSAGFYVRSLAHDLGQALGTGAVLEGLVRIRAGAFGLEHAVSWADLATAATPEARRAGEDSPERRRVVAAVIPLERLLLDLPAVALSPEGVRRVTHGMELRPVDFTGGGTLASPPPGERGTLAPPPPGRHWRLLSPDGKLLGLAEPSKTPGFLHPAVVLG